MNVSYRDIGIRVYGNKCEICSYSIIEVHHIDYHRHQEYEDNIRKASKMRDYDLLEKLIEEAKECGFLEWKGNQLSKDDRSTNLSVLCGNCHSLIHALDSGVNLLNVLSERK